MYSELASWTMRINTLALLGVALLDFANAIDLLTERNNGAPRVLHLETHRKTSKYPPHVRDRIRKRQDLDTLQADLANEQTLYFVEVSIGTPPQDLLLHIDTGSSDIWTNVASSTECFGGFCDASGVYSPNASSSYEYLNSGFRILYADGSYSIGDYATDTLRISGTEIENLQFGIGYESTSQNGILGIGYETNEVQIAYNRETYSNLPTRLVEQDIIGTPAYSLWLNDLDASTGSILFGGVDMEKYEGDLSTLPIVQEEGGHREFVLALTALDADGENVFSDGAVGVLLDSGSSLTYLPDEYAATIFDTFGAQYSPAEGVAICDCSLADSDATVDFTFSEPVISVPMNELVLVGAYQGGDPICILGISQAGNSSSVLGDTFLRSAYVVYDLENNQISLAATNFNATGTNVQEIGSSVPGATDVPNAVATAEVATGGGRLGGVPSGVSAAAGRSGLLPGALLITVGMVGVAVGVGLVAL